MSKMKPSSDWAAFISLLRQTEPIEDKYDVEWWGPYFVPRPKQWHRSHFMLYEGCLYGSLEMGWTTLSAQWNVKSDEVSFQGEAGSGAAWESEEIWGSALPQVTRRLRSALANPTVYNRRVRRLIPLSARTGWIVRKWTWPKRTRPLLSESKLALLDVVCDRCERSKPWASLSSADYFRLVGRMYNAAFPELAKLSIREQHAAKADTRHGGLHDLSADDPRAFREWLESKAWSGCHPWEIVFGHPHGILFSPLLSDEGTWRFHLSVDSPGLYLEAVKMAIALGEEKVPFVFPEKASVIAALRGTDEVEIAPFYGMISLDHLREVRPEAVDRVRWEPIAEINPITGTQQNKVDYVLRTGTPAGWVAPST